MKKAAVIGVLVLLLVLGSPYVAGMLTQSNIEQWIEQESLNSMLATEVVDYDRGWLQSRARIEIGLSEAYLEQLGAVRGEPPLDQAMTRIPFVLDVAHGPLSAANGLHFGMAQFTARPDPAYGPVAQIEEFLGLPYLFEFRGWAGFGNRFEFEADVPPIDYAGTIGDLTFTGFDLAGTLAGRQLNMQGGAQSLEFQSPFAAAIATEIALATDFEFRPDRVPVSDSSFSIERLTVTSPLQGGPPLFDLSRLELASRFAFDATEELLEASVLYSADAVAGNGLSISDARWGVALNGVDADVASDYYRLVSEASTTGDPELILAQLEPLLDRVVRAGFELSLEPMQFSMAEGSFDGMLRVRVDGSSLPPDQPADPRNIAVLLGVVTANADFTIAKPLAQRLFALGLRAQIASSAAANGQDMTDDELTAMAEAQAGFMLVGLVGQGMLADDGENYTSTLEFGNGQATVNGAPLPLNLF